MILDACCGSLKMYKGAVDSLIANGEFVTVDRRKGDFSYEGEKNWGIHHVIEGNDKLCTWMERCAYCE